MFLAGCSCGNVPPGHVGVLSDWGVVQEQTLPEGFYWETVGEDVTYVSTQTGTVTMAGAGRLKAPASDQVVMDVDLSVSYHVNPVKAPEVHRFFPEYEKNIITPAVRAGAYNAVGQFEGQEAVSTGRQKLAKLMSELVIAEIDKVVNARFKGTKGKVVPCFVIDNVALRKIALPGPIQKSIAAVQIERQNTAKAGQKLLTEKAQNLSKAEGIRGRVERQKLQAEGAAEVLRIRTTSEAEANKRVSQSLTPAVLRLEEIRVQQALLKSNKTRTIVLGSGGGRGPIPLLNLQ